MTRCVRVTLVVVSIGLVLAACAVAGSAESCSCAAGITYRGTFYSERAATSAPVGAAIGRTGGGEDCCSGEPGVTIYAIEGVPADVAVATKDSTGRVTIDVASDLTAEQRTVADRLVDQHPAPG